MFPNIPRLSGIVARLHCRVNGHIREQRTVSFGGVTTGEQPIIQCVVCGDVRLINHDSSTSGAIEVKA